VCENVSFYNRFDMCVIMCMREYECVYPSKCECEHVCAYMYIHIIKLVCVCVLCVFVCMHVQKG